MKRIIWTLILPVALIFSCSSDDGPGITQEQRQLIMGDTENGVLVLGLQAPIVVANDGVHITPRDLDMDSNGDLDVTILSYQEFFGNKGLALSTVNSAANAQVAVDADGLVKPYNAGDAVEFESETWVSVDEAPLAVFDASNGTSSGLWNGTTSKYVAFRMQIDNTRFLAWIELSVSDYDNYSFHNYGIKIVP